MCEWCTSRFWHHTKEKASNCMNGAYLKYIGHYSDTFTLGCVFTILPPRQWRGLCDGREAIKFCVSCSNGFCPLQKPISSGKTNTGTDRAKKKSGCWLETPALWSYKTVCTCKHNSIFKDNVERVKIKNTLYKDSWASTNEKLSPRPISLKNINSPRPNQHSGSIRILCDCIFKFLI